VFVVCCVGSGPYDGQITCAGESYRVCVCVRARARACDLETSTLRGSRPELGSYTTKEIYRSNFQLFGYF
jgi:hypothetical protein